MKKLIIVYIVLITAVILLAFARGGGNLLSFIPSIGGANAVVEVNGTKLKLILAKSDQDRMKGLSGRKSLASDQGMLFIFDKKDRHGFWMKDMLFPIDMIYIDYNKVVYVVNNAPASTQAPNLTIYRPDDPANYVLEVNSGIAEKLKIKKGTTIKLTNVK